MLLLLLAVFSTRVSFGLKEGRYERRRVGEGTRTSCIGRAKSEVAFERARSTYSFPATLLRISRPAS